MPANPPPQGGQSMAWTKSKRLIQAIVKEISIVSQFPKTYRNREDITNLPPGVLVVGSQNILSNVSERLQTRQGYAMDGVSISYIQTTAIAANAVTLGSASGINTGDKIVINFTSGITGLVSGSSYYAILASSTTLGFAISNANAITGTYISISGTPVAANVTLEKSSVNAPIISSFDWNSKGNSEIHMRAGFLTSVGNRGKMQFRWVDANGNVFWHNLLTGLTTVNYNFTTFWDTTELIRLSLFVNGTPNLFEWNGAYDTVVSATSSTITVSNPIATTGFYATRNMTVTIRGIDYNYTGISGSTFTGLSVDPTAGVNKIYAGDILYQKVVTNANSSFVSGTPPPATFANGLVLTSNNQLYLGSLTSSTIYVSKINTFVNFNYTAGTRLPGEGATATLDDNAVAFITQGDVTNSNNLPSVYISCGKNYIYKTSLIQSSSFDGTTAITIETFTVVLIKTSPRQGFQSQGLVSNMKNDVIAITYEPTFDTMGLIDQILGTPQTTNISDSIKLDFDSYDFTYGNVFYWKYYLLVSVPKSGVIRLYSLTTKSWEAPQTIPVTRFYTVNGQLYGHSYTSSESYQLFTGYSDRAGKNSEGNPYLVVANFSYQNDGTRTVLKNANKFYIEGYITANTNLNCVINYEQDGNLTQQTFMVNGDDSALIGSQNSSNSLGKSPLGEVGLGSETSLSLTGLPPKFRVIKTFPRFDYYENQFSFSILGVDQNFQLLAFGTNASPSDTTSYAIEE